MSELFCDRAHVPTFTSQENDSNKLFHSAVFAPMDQVPEWLRNYQTGNVDVRDVADVHLRAMEVPEAGGEKFYIGAYMSVWQDWCEFHISSPHLRATPRLT